MDKYVKIAGSLEKKLIGKNYNLSESFIKEFGSRSGFINFINEDKSLCGIALVDKDIEPQIRIMNFGNEPFSRSYIEKSLKKAMEFRENLSNENKLDIGSRAAYRLVNDGSDGLSGLNVDVYGDYINITTFSDYWSNYMNTISDYLLKETGKKGVYWRKNLKKVLPSSKHYMGAKYELDGKNQSTLTVEENGMKLYIDLLDPNSTGLFLDQRENKQIISDLFKNRESGSILNTFAHTCAFSLAPSVRGYKVSSYNIDISDKYFKTAERNFALNGIPLNFHRFVQKDLFTQLEEMKHKSTRFDVIVLDPPTFARSKKFGTFTTKNRYRDLLDLSIPLLNPGGFIVAFANTRSVSENKWLKQIGVKDYNESEETNSNEESIKKKGQNIKIENEKQEIEREFEEIKGFVKTAKLSNVSKNVLPFNKLPGFKAVQYLDQAIDFNIREGDERVAKHLKGVLLKNKVDYSKTKYFTNENKINK
ncbi:hypothetical protein DICPUDRAFT_160058 [Dictyostelium purpureum]|uniref:S-adenosylmethionine-dependent methyltransferase domain-containing protein n=1 Tax=Dictyostelium purpureum TaxID=5786 RepID=F1A5L9_DICPU|nr:uncharacterized protein DICPUDRAFT_160058 [Dictyostelium purpureum]EGC28511.1 hypothetical protein DICPUDRAFT_160058 [Dictyostelium purpureum]|eukprot:XP_003294965.1 hypothetical protein DICPUDRAFT_160058 [Dictyostelium purpureum]